MGLDSSFYLRSRKYPELKVEIAYFRKYFELHEWCTRRCQRIDEYEVKVSADDIKNLIGEIEPIAESLMKLGFQKMAYYDDCGYPKKYHVEFYGKDFDPTDSQSAFAGTKLCNLYFALCTLREMISHNTKDDIYITFCSSY